MFDLDQIMKPFVYLGIRILEIYLIVMEKAYCYYKISEHGIAALTRRYHLILSLQKI